MNKHLLNTLVQDFISKHINSDTTHLLLKGFNFEGVSKHEVIEQIESKKKCDKKLPTWFQAKNIYYPRKINIEQASSEITAHYKANLVSGKSLIDLTGGFGVDCYYFSKKMHHVTHCDIDSELSEIVKHNFDVLNAKTVTNLNENGIEALKRLDQAFDWIYVDPSRRDDLKKKVFLLSDCNPNIKTYQGLFLKYAKNVMVKTSPLLDIKAAQTDLKHIKALHIVAVNNEVKELLWILERDYEAELQVNSINLTKNQKQEFDIVFSDESTSTAEYSLPLTYLYEPNAAILKAGAFKSVCSKLNIPKLHQHSHLYTSEDLIDFPGRRFKIEKTISFNKKAFAKEKMNKANVTTRNFPLSVGDIRKKLKLKDGGKSYLFFTTNKDNEKIIVICSKVT